MIVYSCLILNRRSETTTIIVSTVRYCSSIIEQKYNLKPFRFLDILLRVATINNNDSRGENFDGSGCWIQVLKKRSRVYTVFVEFPMLSTRLFIIMLTYAKTTEVYHNEKSSVFAGKFRYISWIMTPQYSTVAIPSRWKKITVVYRSIPSK